MRKKKDREHSLPPAQMAMKRKLVGEWVGGLETSNQLHTTNVVPYCPCPWPLQVGPSFSHRTHVPLCPRSKRALRLQIDHPSVLNAVLGLDPKKPLTQDITDRVDGSLILQRRANEGSTVHVRKVPQALQEPLAFLGLRLRENVPLRSKDDEWHRERSHMAEVRMSAVGVLWRMCARCEGCGVVHSDQQLLSKTQTAGYYCVTCWCRRLRRVTTNTHKCPTCSSVSACACASHTPTNSAQHTTNESRRTLVRIVDLLSYRKIQPMAKTIIGVIARLICHVFQIWCWVNGNRFCMFQNIKCENIAVTT